MTAPDKIWAACPVHSAIDGSIVPGTYTAKGDWCFRHEYTRTDLVQAAVAAAYEAAAQVAIDRKGFGSDAALVHPYDKGYVAACDAIATAIRALATPDQIAALAASPDTITLPRAEVEALMEEVNAAALTIDYAYGTTDDYGEFDRKYSAFLRKTLATLQERMK